MMDPDAMTEFAGMIEPLIIETLLPTHTESPILILSGLFIISFC